MTQQIESAWRASKHGAAACVQRIPAIVAVVLLSCDICSAQDAPFTFTTIDIPAATSALSNGIVASGINDNGDIAGSYVDKTTFQTHGFIYRNGTLTPFDAPGAMMSFNGTLGVGINNSGHVSGYYFDQSGRTQGFIYRSLEAGPGAFSNVDCDAPNATGTVVYGINNAGTVVGTCNNWGVPNRPNTPSFSASNGVFTPILVPGALAPVVQAISDTAVVVGTYAAPGRVHGFVGQTTLDVVGATTTSLKGINNAGFVVGMSNAPGLGSFFYDPNNATDPFQAISVSNMALATFAGGINNHGQIVGTYVDVAGIHIFVATPVCRPGSRVDSAARLSDRYETAPGPGGPAPESARTCPGGSTPVITSQPQGQTISTGATANLTVVASGAGLTYQWYAGVSGTLTSPIAGATSSSYTTPALTSNRRYWVRVSNSSGGTNSNTATIAVAFTDTPLAAGLNSSRLLHIIELRTRIDALRVAKGLAPYSWTDALLVAQLSSVKAVHVVDLRTALSQAYAASGLPAPVFTDPVLTPTVSIVKAVHIGELRSAVTALE